MGVYNMVPLEAHMLLTEARLVCYNHGPVAAGALRLAVLKLSILRCKIDNDNDNENEIR